MKKEKTITIEVGEDEFFAFQQFKKSVDRAAVVYKYNCGYGNEYLAILNNDELQEKSKTLIDQKDKTIDRLYLDINKCEVEIKQLKDQLDFMKKHRFDSCPEVKEKRKPWFQFTIGR